MLGSSFDAGVVDQVAAFVAPRIVGGATAPTAVAGEGVRLIAEGRTLDEVRSESLGPDFVIEGYVASR